MRWGILFGACTLTTLSIVACVGDIDPQVTTIFRAAPPAPTRVPPRSPPAPDDPPEPPPDCPADVSLTVVDLDKEIGWKSAKASPGACTAADIAQLEANFVSTNIKTYFDLGQGISAPCFACAFAKDTDAFWGPVVGIAENDGETGFMNVGACAGVMGGEACGKARQYEAFCFNVACNECTFSQVERDACIAKSRVGSGMCTEFARDAAIACADAGAGCGPETIDDIRTLCGTKDDDAGM